MTSIVVFASGVGSNFRAICQAIREKTLAARVEALVCNVPGAGALSVAKEFGIRCLEIPERTPDRKRLRAEHEGLILGALSEIRFDWIVLAGYMRLLTPGFVKRFTDAERGCARIVNIHTSLLPAFSGVAGYAQALHYGAKVTGVTVHLVGDGLDDGPIVAQRALKIRDDDTVETLLERGLAVEHSLYAETLGKLFAGAWRVKGAEHARRPRIVFGEEVARG